MKYCLQPWDSLPDDWCCGKKTSMKPRVADNIPWIIYIYLIYIYLLLFYKSSILDIEYSPYYIVLGSTQTPKSDLVTTLNTLKMYMLIYIYIVTQRQTCFVLSELFSVVRQARFPKLGSKRGWFKRQSKILPLSHEETSASEGNLIGYLSHLFWFYIYPLNGLALR